MSNQDWRSALIESLNRFENAKTKLEKYNALRDIREIKKGINEKIQRKTSLKETRKHRIAREKAYDSFEIQTNPNPYLHLNCNYFKDYVLGEWNE